MISFFIIFLFVGELLFEPRTSSLLSHRLPLRYVPSPWRDDVCSKCTIHSEMSSKQKVGTRFRTLTVKRSVSVISLVAVSIPCGKPRVLGPRSVVKTDFTCEMQRLQHLLIFTRMLQLWTSGRARHLPLCVLGRGQG